MPDEGINKLRNLIKDEINRSKIRSLITEVKHKSLFDTITRHQLVSVVIGCLLTGLLGSLLSYCYQEKQEKNKLKNQAYEHVRQFSELLAERRTEAAYLFSALKRHVDKENLIKRKETYDRAVKKWNIYFLGHLLKFREYAESREVTFFECNIEQDLVPLLSTIDKCLTKAYDCQIKGSQLIDAEHLVCEVEIENDKKTIPLDALIKAANKCGYEIANTLFHYITLNIKSYDKGFKGKYPGTRVTISER